VISEQSPRFFLETILDTNSSLLQAHLHIERTERADSGLYVCIASNHYGRDEDRISLEVKGSFYTRFITPVFALSPENENPYPEP